MKELRLEAAATIAAAPELVFFVLTDFANYPSWNPFQLSVGTDAAPLAPGKVLEIEIALNDPAAPSTSAQRVEEVSAPHLMRWSDTGKFSLVTDITRDFVLEPTASGGTRYTTCLLFRGPFSLVASTRYGDVLQQGLIDEAQALRAQCEKVAGHLL